MVLVEEVLVQVEVLVLEEALVEEVVGQVEVEAAAWWRASPSLTRAYTHYFGIPNCDTYKKIYEFRLHTKCFIKI